MKSEKISKIRKRFHRQWLLIRVDKMDRATTTVKLGRLLAHSSNRDEIYEAMIHTKGLTMVTHSDDYLPPGYAVVL